MRASAWKNGGNTYGISVGKPNREAYFEQHWQSIEVVIDDGSHTFKLTPSFWNDCPHFGDSGASIIRDWLQTNYSLPWPKGKPPQMQLLPLGEGRFELTR